MLKQAEPKKPANNGVAVANTSKEKPGPVRVIRSGAIAASVWRRQTSTGFEYLDFSLSRSWKLKDGSREGYSQSFFADNADALCDVIDETRQYIAGLNALREADQPADKAA